MVLRFILHLLTMVTGKPHQPEAMGIAPSGFQPPSWKDAPPLPILALSITSYFIFFLILLIWVYVFFKFCLSRDVWETAVAESWGY